MFRNKLTALQYPAAASIDISDYVQFAQIVLWLEDQKIRHYAIEDRAGLRNIDGDDIHWAKQWNIFYDKYKEDVGMPSTFVTIAEQLSWLLGYAIRLEYFDNVDEFKAVDSKSIEQINYSSLNNLDAQSMDFQIGVNFLAKKLKITQYPDHLKRLEASAMVIQRTFSKNPPKSKTAADGNSYSMNDDQSTKQFKEQNLNDGAKALRLLQVQNIRQLQTKINETIVAVQELSECQPQTTIKKSPQDEFSLKIKTPELVVAETIDECPPNIERTSENIPNIDQHNISTADITGQNTTLFASPTIESNQTILVDSQSVPSVESNIENKFTEIVCNYICNKESMPESSNQLDKQNCTKRKIHTDSTNLDTKKVKIDEEKSIETKVPAKRKLNDNLAVVLLSAATKIPTKLWFEVEFRLSQAIVGHILNDKRKAPVPGLDYAKFKKHIIITCSNKFSKMFLEQTIDKINADMEEDHKLSLIPLTYIANTEQRQYFYKNLQKERPHIYTYLNLIK